MQDLTELQALVHYITPGLKSSMFGVEKPREVTLQKVGGLSFGFTLRGSYPTFMVRVDHGGLAERKVWNRVCEVV